MPTPNTPEDQQLRYASIARERVIDRHGPTTARDALYVATYVDPYAWGHQPSRFWQGVADRSALLSGVDAWLLLRSRYSECPNGLHQSHWDWLESIGDRLLRELCIRRRFPARMFRFRCSCGNWYEPTEVCSDLITCEECGGTYHDGGDGCPNERECDFCSEWYHDLPGDGCPNHYTCDHCESDVRNGDECECLMYCDCDECADNREMGDGGDPHDDMGTPDVIPPNTRVRAAPGRRRFGIEIEFNRGASTHQAVLAQLLQRGVAASERSYTHDIVRYWKLTTDASVSGGELVSPILDGSDQSIGEAMEAVRAVKDAGGITGRNCGMHIHYDVSDFQTDQLIVLARNLQLFEPTMQAYLPQYRLDESGYSTPLDEECWDEIHNWIQHVDVSERARTVERRNASCPLDREMGINFNSLLTYGTIEVRYLGHTLNTRKIEAWLRTCMAMFVASEHMLDFTAGDVLSWLHQNGGADDRSLSFYRDIADQRGTSAQLVVA